MYLLIRSVVADLQQRTHGSVFDTINRATFDGLSVVAPSNNVLIGFEKAIVPLFDLLLASLTESAKLAELRDYLLPKLLSGKMRASDAVVAAEELV